MVHITIPIVERHTAAQLNSIGCRTAFNNIYLIWIIVTWIDYFKLDQIQIQIELNVVQSNPNSNWIDLNHIQIQIELN